ncbi:MAG: hypothetical protein R2942_03560 [Ignavibacteria bacterium]
METIEKNDFGQKINYDLLLRPQSLFDIEEAYLWYEGKEKNSGLEFIEQIETSFERVRSYPFSYQIIKKKLRRALVKISFRNIFKNPEKILIFVVFNRLGLNSPPLAA